MSETARKLGRDSLIYVLGNVLSKGVVFLLIPLVSRYLTPEAYGALGIVATVNGLMCLILGFSMDSALCQFYFLQKSESELRTLMGTILGFWFTVPLLLVVILDFLGCQGHLEIFHSLPFASGLRLALWTSYLTVFSSSGQLVFMLRQQPGRSVAIGVLQAGATVFSSWFLVVELGLGLTGAVGGLFVGALTGAVVSLWVMCRAATYRISLSVLGNALIFSIPLVPHLLSNWVLNLSDRILLEKMGKAKELGFYTLAYQFGLLLSIVVTSANNAFVPFSNKHLGEQGGAAMVATQGTRLMMAFIFSGLAISLFAGDAIRILTPPAYHHAAAFVPWITMGYVFQGAYFLLSRGTWFSLRTGWVPFVTGGAAAANLALNFLFIPKYGAMAAAVNTLVTFLLLAVIHGLLAHRLHPIPWEYAKWAQMLMLAFGCIIASTYASRFTGFWGLLSAKIILLIGVFLWNARQLGWPPVFLFGKESTS